MNENIDTKLARAGVSSGFCPGSVRVVSEGANRGNPTIYSESRAAGGFVGFVTGDQDGRPADPAAYVPFPVGSLPAGLRELVAGGAEAIGCDPAMIGVVGLATLAAAVGSARVIELKPEWREPCILWAITVGESSARKSPGYDLATRPLVRVQRECFREHEEERKRQGEQPEEAREAGYGRGSISPCRRVLVDDVTLDAVAPILRDNPRGVLVGCEELDAWFQSFTRYSAGGATDRPRWLKLYGARTLVVDRKGGGSISVPLASASIAGTIQPGVLSRAMTVDVRDSGLAARFLIAYPPRRPFAWTDATVPPGIEEGYERLVRALLSLPLEHYQDGDPRPVPLPLTREARELFKEFVNRIGRRIEEAHGADMRALLGKLVGTAARLALVCELSAAFDPSEATTVGAVAMVAGIALAEWFAGEAERVYGLLAETGGEKARRELVEYVERKGGAVTARDLQRDHRRQFTTAKAATLALDELVKSGFGRWEELPVGPSGGRPAHRFILDTGGGWPGDKTDKTPGRF